MLIYYTCTSSRNAFWVIAKKKIKFDLGLIKDHYVGRTFIEPAKIRSLGVKLR